MIQMDPIDQSNLDGPDVAWCCKSMIQMLLYDMRHDPDVLI